MKDRSRGRKEGRKEGWIDGRKAGMEEHKVVRTKIIANNVK